MKTMEILRNHSRLLNMHGQGFLAGKRGETLHVARSSFVVLLPLRILALACLVAVAELARHV